MTAATNKKRTYDDILESPELKKLAIEQVAGYSNTTAKVIAASAAVPVVLGATLVTVASANPVIPIATAGILYGGAKTTRVITNQIDTYATNQVAVCEVEAQVQAIYKAQGAAKLKLISALMKQKRSDVHEIIAKMVKNTTDKNTQTEFKKLQSIFYKFQYLEEAKSNCKKISSLVQKFENSQPILDEEKVTPAEFRAILSYNNLFNEIIHSDYAFADNITTQDGSLTEIKDLIDAAKGAHGLIAQIQDKIDFNSYPTGTLFFTKEELETPLFSAGEPLLNRNSVSQSLRSGAISSRLKHAKKLTKTAYKHVSSGHPSRLKPFFLGSITHIDIGIKKFTSKKQTYNLVLARIFKSFDVLKPELSHFITTETHQFTTEKLIPEHSQQKLKEYNTSKETKNQIDVQKLFEDQLKLVIKNIHEDKATEQTLKFSEARALSAPLCSANSNQPSYRLPGTAMSFTAERLPNLLQTVVGKTFSEAPSEPAHPELANLKQQKEITCGEFVAKAYQIALTETEKQIKTKITEFEFTPLFGTNIRFASIHPTKLYNTMKEKQCLNEIKKPEILEKLLKK